MSNHTASKDKALILIDEANLFYGFKKQRWELDYDKFYQWLHKEFNPIDIFLFSGMITKKLFFDKHPGYTIGGFIRCKKAKEIRRR